MNGLKFGLVAIVLLVSGGTHYYACFLPWRCSTRLPPEEREARRTFELVDPIARARAATASVKRCQKCLAPSPDRIGWYLIAAANYRMLGRYDDAIRHYDESLKLFQQPEIYLNRGYAKLEKGDRAGGIEDIVQAARLNVHIIQGLHFPELSNEVNRRLHLRPNG